MEMKTANDSDSDDQNSLLTTSMGTTVVCPKISDKFNHLCRLCGSIDNLSSIFSDKEFNIAGKIRKHLELIVSTYIYLCTITSKGSST